MSSIGYTGKTELLDQGFDELYDLLSWTPPIRFDGASFNLDRDGIRLNAQLRRVVEFLLPGQWTTLREIASATGDPEASVSARIRDCSKDRFGLTAYFTVEKEFVARGLWKYRMVRI